MFDKAYSSAVNSPETRQPRFESGDGIEESYSFGSLGWLESMPPGPELAVALAAIDVASLAGRERSTVLVAHRRLAAHYSGAAYRDIAAIEAWMRTDGDESQAAVENTAAEVGAALVLTRRRAERETNLAMELCRRLPAVLGALLAGDIDVRRAEVLVYGTEHLPAATARLVVDQVIADAPRWTTGQLAAAVRRRAITADPDGAEKRYRRSLQDRKVYAAPTPQGTANLYGLDLPVERVEAFRRYLDHAARQLRSNGETRTMDQLRADVFLDILEGVHRPAAGGGGGGGVHLVTTLETLAGLSEQPGELGGYGPVIAEVARRIADGQHHGGWTYTVCDPTTGDVVHGGTVRRRPNRGQRRRIQARDRTCVWPGCRMPSVDCDLDHRTPWAEGGCSHDHNLGPLCRHHHRLRHQARWSYRRLRNGDHRWTTKLGRTVTVPREPP